MLMKNDAYQGKQKVKDQWSKTEYVSTQVEHTLLEVKSDSQRDLWMGLIP